MTEFLQHLVNGLGVGTIYALIALGYTMVYGVLKLINFAHGDVYMVGAYAGLYLGRLVGIDDQHPSILRTALVFVLAMAACALLGLAIERFAYRPLRHRPRLTALITAIGISFLLEYGFQLPPLVSFGGIGFPPGPTPAFFPRPFATQPWNIAGVAISNYDVISLGAAVAFMLGLHWIVYRTKLGMAMRAVSFDSRVAGLMGINVNTVIAATFALGSALAAVAALLIASSRPSINPLMGLMPGIKAFVAAVIGGIGNVAGAMVGGLLLGLAEEFVAGYTVSSYRDAIAFGILILVLLLRPTGLFGQMRAEKV